MANEHKENKVNNEPSVISDVISADGYTAEEERLALEAQRIVRLDTYTKKYSGGDDIRVPLDSLESLRNTVGMIGPLQSCNRMKARCVAGLGYDIVESPYTQDEIDPKEKPLLEEWARHVFCPSLPTVMNNLADDYEDMGQGLLLIDENMNSIIKDSKKKGREISKIRHLVRLGANILNPRKISITKPDGSHIDIDDPEDVEYPRWKIGTGSAATYARTYGDPRFIHKYTGETSRQTFGKENAKVLLDGPSVAALTRYDSRDPVCGFPIWFSEMKSCDVVWEINRYEYGHFRRNCMPSLIGIFPAIKAASGKTIREQMQELLHETSAQRAAGADSRKVVTIEYTENFTRNQGQMQFLLQEIKGPDPAKFIELEKWKNQLIAIATQFPPSLIHADTGSLGSGKDKETEIKRFKEFTVDPEQRRINVEILDKLILHGTNFKTVVLRLKSIDTSDLDGEINRAEKIDKIRSLMLHEKREKLGVTHPISDDAVEAERLGKVFLFGAQDQAVTPEVMSAQLDLAITSMEQLDQNQPITDQPLEKLDEQRLINTIASFMTGNPTPESVRTVMIGLKDKVLPAVREALAK